MCWCCQCRRASTYSGYAVGLQVIKYALIVLHADDNGQGAPHPLKERCRPVPCTYNSLLCCLHICHRDQVHPSFRFSTTFFSR